MESKELAPIHTFSDLEKMASAIAKSGLFGMRTTEQALALMIVAQAEGRHPGKVAIDYHIIDGKPSLKADTMLSRFQESGGKIKWLVLNEKKCEAEFSHPSAGTFRLAWTLEMAEKAGLADRKNWKAYPRAMLRARTISEGIRTAFPGILAGMYTPEEIQDISAEPVNIVNQTQGNSAIEEAQVIPPSQPPETISPRAQKIRRIFEISVQKGQSKEQMLQTISEFCHTPIKESSQIPTEKLDDLIQYFQEVLNNENNK